MWSSFSCRSLKLRQPTYRITLVVLLVMLMTVPLSYAKEAWQETLPDARPLGSGELTWFGLRIYQATLWSAEQPLNRAKPFALQLQYARDISRERLVSTSIKEIKRLADSPVPAETIADWEARLSHVFIDVARGDQLIGVYLPQDGMLLYNKEGLLGSIPDVALAQAFFDIWLHPASKDRALRQQLLGVSR